MLLLGLRAGLRVALGEVMRVYVSEAYTHPSRNHARGPRGSDAELRPASQARQAMAEIVEVGVANRGSEYLVDDRREVGQRANHSQRRRVSRTRQPSRGGQHECILDHCQRHRAREQLRSQHTVRFAAPHRSCRAWRDRRRAHAARIQPSPCRSTLRLAQRRAVDMHRVAVVPHAAQ